MEQLEQVDNWFERYGIRHIAIIPDGNRRWARKNDHPVELGHSKGLLEVLPDLVCRLSDVGVHTMTVWGFSTENWNRPSSEVGHLMRIFAEFLSVRLPRIAARYQARVFHIGRKDRLHPKVLAAIERLEQTTATHDRHVYNLALDYGGEDEVARAAQRLATAARANRTESLRITDFLDTHGQPHARPDIVIRSSGEQRLSGFLPLQTTYSELFFLDELFPDFTFDLLARVADDFQARQRRFGK
jgi:undecaprenyl diphosphate synthase